MYCVGLQKCVIGINIVASRQFSL